MDRRLQRIDSFHAQGTDGNDYVVNAFEHLGRIDAVLPHSLIDDWLPLGLTELQLSDGRRVDEDDQGRMSIVGTDIELQRMTRH